MKKAETKDRIKEAMKIREIKQIELVERTGIDKGQMSSYVSGKYKPKQKNLSLLAQALAVDETWLMGYDVPMEGPAQRNLRLDSPKILQFYDQLNDMGKHEATKRVEELTHLPRYVTEDTGYVNAAHALEGTSEEDVRHDEDIMDADDF